MNFATFFELHARGEPDKIALVDRGRRWTYGELDQMANRFANTIVAMGLRREDRVAVRSLNRVELAISLLGGWKAGVVTVPLNTRLGSDDVLRLLRHASPKLVVAPQSEAEALRGYRVLDFAAAGATGSFWSTIAGASPDFASVGAQNSDVANLLYTSGTTSLPKAVIHTHGMRASIAGTMVHCFRMSRHDVALSISPIFHTGGMSVFCNAMFVGGTVVMMTRWDINEFARLIAEEGITYTHVVSTIAVDIARAPESLFDPAKSRMRFTWGGGHATDPSVFKVYEQRVGGLFLQGYSRTEGGIAYNPLDPAKRRFDMHGFPNRNNSDLGIFNRERGTLTGAGEAGEIVVAGDGVSPGYWDGDFVRTPRPYRGGWSPTGDIGFIADDGALHFIGREDHMIKTGGENVYPSEVSSVLMAIPGVSDAVVFDVPDDRLGQRIAALVVAKDPALSLEALDAACRAKLPGFKIPRSVILVDALPRLGSEKVDLEACRRVIRDAATRSQATAGR